MSHEEKKTPVTGDFSTFSKSENENTTEYKRYSVSTTKRRPYQRRKLMAIKPLRFDIIRKEIEEAEKSRNQSNYDDCDKENRNNHQSLQESFDLNFAELSLSTPTKEPEKEKSDTSKKQFLSPNNNFPVKVQWSARMRPITKFETVQDECESDCDSDKALKPPPDLDTKKFQVNNVDKFATPCPPDKHTTMNHYSTPNQQISSKVQWSAGMKSISKLKIIQPEYGNGCVSSNVQMVPQLNFRKIWVNNVVYIVLNQLGKGGSSEVFHCYNPEAKVLRAIKVVSLQNRSAAVGYINEVKMLQTLQKCNRVIKMYDYEIKQEEELLLVVLEVGGTDLSKILKDLAQRTDHMPLYKLLCYWMEMLYAVKQIHRNGIIHSDLKPANFLEVEGYLKLIDFGIARSIQDDMTSVFKAVPEGSFSYISPEALREENSSNVNSPSFGIPKYKISYKSDVWSLGCILYQLVYRRTPFQHVTPVYAKIVTILDPNHKINYPDVSWVPQKIVETLKKCLQSNMKARPSIDELIGEYENIFQSIV